MRFGIFPCFQWRCSGNWAPQVSASVFFVLVGNISNSIRFFSTKFMARLRAKLFLLPRRQITFSFRYIDLQISSFNQIPFWILIFFFKSLIPNWSGVILWQIRRKTLEALGANSHFPVPCPPYLGASGQLFQVFNCPRLGLRDQIKLNRILKLE